MVGALDSKISRTERTESRFEESGRWPRDRQGVVRGRGVKVIQTSVEPLIEATKRGQLFVRVTDPSRESRVWTWTEAHALARAHVYVHGATALRVRISFLEPRYAALYEYSSKKSPGIIWVSLELTRDSRYYFCLPLYGSFCARIESSFETRTNTLRSLVRSLLSSSRPRASSRCVLFKFRPFVLTPRSTRRKSYPLEK